MPLHALRSWCRGRDLWANTRSSMPAPARASWLSRNHASDVHTVSSVSVPIRQNRMGHVVHRTSGCMHSRRASNAVSPTVGSVAKWMRGARASTCIRRWRTSSPCSVHTTAWRKRCAAGAVSANAAPHTEACTRERVGKRTIARGTTLASAWVRSRASNNAKRTLRRTRCRPPVLEEDPRGLAGTYVGARPLRESNDRLARGLLSLVDNRTRGGHRVGCGVGERAALRGHVRAARERGVRW